NAIKRNVAKHSLIQINGMNGCWLRLLKIQNVTEKIPRQGPVIDMHPATILNTTLPPNFRQIRIELAREPEHPSGESGIAYIIIAPLDADDRIDAEQWKHHREACRVIR